MSKQPAVLKHKTNRFLWCFTAGTTLHKTDRTDIAHFSFPDGASKALCGPIQLKNIRKSLTSKCLNPRHNLIIRLTPRTFTSTAVLQQDKKLLDREKQTVVGESGAQQSGPSQRSLHRRGGVCSFSSDRLLGGTFQSIFMLRDKYEKTNQITKFLCAKYGTP